MVGQFAQHRFNVQFQLSQQQLALEQLLKEFDSCKAIVCRLNLFRSGWAKWLALIRMQHRFAQMLLATSAWVNITNSLLTLAILPKLVDQETL